MAVVMGAVMAIMIVGFWGFGHHGVKGGHGMKGEDRETIMQNHDKEAPAPSDGKADVNDGLGNKERAKEGK